MSDCLSRDPYCARFPAPSGSYEAYIGSLCGECEDQQRKQDQIKRCMDLCDEDECGDHDPAFCACKHEVVTA